MPIKYNLTKNDILASKFHQLSQKNIAELSDHPSQEDLLQAQAILIASFSSSHSWQTFKCITEMNMERLRSNDIKSEYQSAKTERWKHVTTRDIEEVAKMNITPSLFSIWLSFNTERERKQTYRSAWDLLVGEFQKECDMKVESTVR